MSNAFKNRTRLSLEDLEGRTLADAKVLGAVAAPLGEAVVRTASVQASSIGFDMPITYSVVTLKNTTTATIGMKFSWDGVHWSSHTLTPGQTWFYWTAKPNVTGQISFDKSFATGYQEQKYSLPSKNFVGGGFADIMPQASNGKIYTFKGVLNGVQLYS